jgi:hypothetical protein
MIFSGRGSLLMSPVCDEQEGKDPVLSFRLEVR